jgi:hypothetical protein
VSYSTARSRANLNKIAEMDQFWVATSRTKCPPLVIATHPSSRSRWSRASCFTGLVLQIGSSLFTMAKPRPSSMMHAQLIGRRVAGRTTAVRVLVRTVKRKPHDQLPPRCHWASSTSTGGGKLYALSVVVTAYPLTMVCISRPAYSSYHGAECAPGTLVSV